MNSSRKLFNVTQSLSSLLRVRSVISFGLPWLTTSYSGRFAPDYISILPCSTSNFGLTNQVAIISLTILKLCTDYCYLFNISKIYLTWPKEALSLALS